MDVRKLNGCSQMSCNSDTSEQSRRTLDLFSIRIHHHYVLYQSDLTLLLVRYTIGIISKIAYEHGTRKVNMTGIHKYRIKDCLKIM
jgi:hypothetical protein